MKAFKFYLGDSYYAYAGETFEKAESCFYDEISVDDYDVAEEIPESEWDKKTINIWEDNDFSTDPFQMSTREAMQGMEAHMLFTNDNGFF